MTDLDALLAGIVADPSNALRWLVMADWLEDHGQPERAELVRVHRELLRTCTATRETKARKQLHARMMELMRSGVQPCIPQRTITLPGGVEMRFSFVPPGSFLMGFPKTYSRAGRHQVTLTRGFWLGMTPVTQRQWKAVVAENPSRFQGDKLPVEMVSWEDAQAFCTAVKEQASMEARLPTEAEWEYAARSGTTTPFYWGEVLNGTQANCDGKSPFGTEAKGPNLKKTTVVGRYLKAAPHPWGLVDMLGNVWEWCSDWKGDYPTDAGADPTGPQEGSWKVRRGGSWRDAANSCLSGIRNNCVPDYPENCFGFRLAADLSALA